MNRSSSYHCAKPKSLMCVERRQTSRNLASRECCHDWTKRCEESRDETLAIMGWTGSGTHASTPERVPGADVSDGPHSDVAQTAISIWSCPESCRQSMATPAGPARRRMSDEKQEKDGKETDQQAFHTLATSRAVVLRRALHPSPTAR